MQATELIAGQVVVVLDRPQDIVNIGAVVRALKNMGFQRLRLVDPRPFDPGDLLRYAHHCEDIVAAIETHATLDSALADVGYVIGTAAHPHAGRPVRNDTAALVQDALLRTQSAPVAFLFGTEDDGLGRAALDRCHAIAMLPTNPDYPALNLAQSVLLFLYELRLAGLRLAGAGGAGQPPEQPTVQRTVQPAGAAGPMQADMERLFAMLEEALQAIGFFRYNPVVAMRSLRLLLYRAEPTQAETALLMAIARQMIYAAGRAQSGAPQPD